MSCPKNINYGCDYFEPDLKPWFVILTREVYSSQKYQLIVNWPWGVGSFRLAWEKSTVRVRLVLPRRGWLWACGRRVSWVIVRRSQTCEPLPRKPWCVPVWFPTTDRPFCNRQNTSNTISTKQKHTSVLLLFKGWRNSSYPALSRVPNFRPM